MSGEGSGSALGLFFPHKAETGSVTVRVAVSYLADQSEPKHGRWFWSYHIRIENHGADEIQLVSRRWIITDGRGARHKVEGGGVVGEMPVIGAGESYDYVSGCPLPTPTGAMEGSYRMIGADGGGFDVAIPRFPLTATAAGS